MQYLNSLSIPLHSISSYGDAVLYTLSNGLKVVVSSVPGSRVSHCGLIVNAGSRDDGSNPGLAHCLEHMLFKGTKNRKSIHIINRLEVVGGELNAFTTKEITSIYAGIVNNHFEKAVELIADIAFNSTFPENELVKEKKVIAEEINQYLDSPEENIYDEFHELIFKDHPLSTNILGDEKSVMKITSKNIREFVGKHYHNQNMVFSYAGSLPPETVLKMVNKYFDLPETSHNKNIRKAFDPELYKPQTITKKTDHIQAYAIIGAPSFSLHHPDRQKLQLLINILGGPGMNSRLNLSVREKYGYTYNIEAGVSSFEDTGLFHCYTSTDVKNLEKTVKLIEKELKKLMTEKLSEVQLTKFKNQYTSQLILAEENRAGLMLHYGQSIARGLKSESLEQLLKKIETIEAGDLLEIANQIFNFDRLSYLYYLPNAPTH